MNIIYQEKVNKINAFYKKSNGTSQWEYGPPSVNKTINEVIDSLRIEDIGEIVGKEREIHISFNQGVARYRAILVRKEMAKEFSMQKIEKNFLGNLTWRWLIYVKRKMVAILCVKVY